jgi:putative membrane protein
MRVTFCAGALALCLCLPRLMLAQEENPVSDQKFADKAANIDKAEVKLAQLALEKTSNADVKKFAERMVQDHSRMDKKLTGIMTQQNLPMPERLDAKHQALYDRLSRLQGEEFDRAYAAAMVKGHTEAIQLFESEARNGKDAAIRSLAETEVPTLKEHLALAEKMPK